MFFPSAFLIAAALATPPPGIAYSSGMASVAWVRAEGEAAGTGFVVDVRKRWLVTCRHVVGEKKAVEIFFPWYRDGQLVTERQEYLSNRETLRKFGLLVGGKVLRTSDEGDLALVEPASLPAGTREAEFAVGRARPGEPLTVVGNRHDVETLWNATTGPARAGGRLRDGYFWRGTKLARQAEVLIGQFPIEEGDSGGPVMNARGELVGAVTALRRGCPLAAVAVTAAEIGRFLDRVPTSAELRPGHRDDPFARLMEATVWVRPTATDYRCAGILIDAPRALYLTSARAVAGAGDRVGVALPTWLGVPRNRDRDCGHDADPAALQAAGCWHPAQVLACDPRRDLALVGLEFERGPHGRVIELAGRAPKAGDRVHSMSHPGGLEFSWAYASGSVRQRGRVNLYGTDPDDRVDGLVLQLPTQGNSPGGPVLNDAGELVGILSSRNGPLGQVGYAASAVEIARFLDVTREDGVTRTPDGAVARLVRFEGELRTAAAAALLGRAKAATEEGRHVAAEDLCGRAAALAAKGPEALRRHAKSLIALDRPEAAAAVLDTGIGRGCRDHDVLALRAGLARTARDHRRARGLLEAALEIDPASRRARMSLADTLFVLGEDEKAAAAYAALVRVRPPRPIIGIWKPSRLLENVSRELLAQADRVAANAPGDPGRLANWMQRVYAAIRAESEDEELSGPLDDLSKAAAAAKSDAGRLKVLRAFADKWAGGPEPGR